MILCELRRRFADPPYGAVFATLTDADLPATFDELAQVALFQLRNKTPVLTPYHAYEVLFQSPHMPSGTWPRDT
jgi:hypothetical protein